MIISYCTRFKSRVSYIIKSRLCLNARFEPLRVFRPILIMKRFHSVLALLYNISYQVIFHLNYICGGLKEVIYIIRVFLVGLLINDKDSYRVI
ncbi:hypothetical protein Hanom_Chr05g00439731 [Helianthus anomalus]